MVKSSFSGKEIPPGKGIMYVKKDGKILWFLNRKEEKNMFKLGRKPRTVSWTEEYRKAKNQRIAMATAHTEEPAKTAVSKQTTTASKPSAAKKATPKTAKKVTPKAAKKASAKKKVKSDD